VVSLQTQKDCRAVQRLPFCHLCGDNLREGDITDGDHVPAKATFNARDREPALKLQTHKRCNADLSVDDKKIGQRIALRRRESPPPRRDQAQRHVVAVTNLNIDAAVWRWIRGFHQLRIANRLWVRATRSERRFPGRMKSGAAHASAASRTTSTYRRHVETQSSVAKSRSYRNKPRPPSLRLRVVSE
jgi:hypothetical protein